MKLFKKLAVLCTALTLCAGVGATMSACGEDAPAATAYQFKIVKADGSAASNYMIQLCDADGCDGGPNTISDANGNVTFNIAAGAYEIHVMDMATSNHAAYEAKYNGAALSLADLDGDDKEYSITPSNYGTITITLQ